MAGRQQHGGPPGASHAVVDYRKIRDMLRSGAAAVCDAANTPPPPLKNLDLGFLGRGEPSHPDVWGSDTHPYGAAPPGMATLLSSGGSPLRPGPPGDPEEEEEGVPEPPPVMRRARFFAAIRTSLNVLHSGVTSAVDTYSAPDEDTDETSLVPTLDPEELAAKAAAKRAALLGRVEEAFGVAMEEMGSLVYQVGAVALPHERATLQGGEGGEEGRWSTWRLVSGTLGIVIWYWPHRGTHGAGA